MQFPFSGDWLLEKNINKIKFREIARFKINKDKNGNKNHDKSKLYF